MGTVPLWAGFGTGVVVHSEYKVPKSQLNEYFSSGLSSSALFDNSSMHTLENHLQSLDPHSSYLQLFEGQVEDSTRTLPFFYYNVMDHVRNVLRKIAHQDDLVYALRREFDPNGERLYTGMHTAAWGWDVQVQRPNLLYGNVS